MKIAVIVLVAVCMLRAEPSSFEARKAQARTLLDQGHYQEALGIAQSISREWKDDVQTYELMAEAHLGLGNYKGAETDLQWMLDLREGRADAHGWYLVARYREATGDTEGALEAVNTALARLSPAEEKEGPKLQAYLEHLQGRSKRSETAEPINVQPNPVPTDKRIAAAEGRLKQQPENNAAADELVTAYLQKMRETADGSYLERATRLVDAMLKRDPSDYSARWHQVEIELQRHHFKRVITMTDALTAERPDGVVVWGLRGDAFMELGEYDSAQAAYQKMVDLRPGLSSYNRIAFYRFVTGDVEGAIDIMRQAIRIGGPPENLAWCLSDMGSMLFKTGAIAEAEKAYREALKEFPGYHRALAGLSRVLAAQGRYEDAIEAALKAQSQAPFPEYAALLAKLYRKTAQESPAEQQIALLDVCDKLDQATGEFANRNLSLAYSDLDHRAERALALAKAELDVRRDVYTFDALAWALFKNGKATEAAAAMDKAIRQNTPEPAFYEHAAKIFEAVGRSEMARRQHERAEALNPKFDIS
jgi:tetratricopeptide (TPR) repeat protein